MSDYLSSLTTRSFAPLGEVRPRLPARFEGVSLPDESLPLDLLEQDEFVTRPPAARAAPMPPPPLMHIEPSPIESTARPIAMPSRQGEIQPRAEPPSERPQGSEPIRPVTVSPLVEPSHAEPIQEISDVQPAVPRTVQPTLPRPEVPLRREPIESIRPVLAEPMPAYHEPEKHSAEPSAQRSSPTMISPRPMVQAEPASGMSIPLPVKPSAQETVVRVSIGRIEVRVKTPPVKAAPRTVAPAPLRPAVSLSDYLKRRDGGKS